MSRSQRLAFLGIAVVIAVVAVILIAGSGRDEEEASPTGAQATPTATETAAPEATETKTPKPTPTPKPKPPLVTTDEVTKLEFKEGDQIQFRVRSDVADHVHVHGYNLMKDIQPGQTITFSFPADITGIFEVELEDAQKEIAKLQVNPS